MTFPIKEPELTEEELLAAASAWVDQTMPRKRDGGSFLGWLLWRAITPTLRMVAITGYIGGYNDTMNRWHEEVMKRARSRAN